MAVSNLRRKSMMNRRQTNRRHFLVKGGHALLVFPLVVLSCHANASTNAALRTSLKYQDKPLGDKKCANCAQFVPGSSAEGMGTCKIIAGDTEISSQGYCIGWAKKI
jgi:hypothetical protein